MYNLTGNIYATLNLMRFVFFYSNLFNKHTTEIKLSNIFEFEKGIKLKVLFTFSFLNSLAKIICLHIQIFQTKKKKNADFKNPNNILVLNLNIIIKSS